MNARAQDGELLGALAPAEQVAAGDRRAPRNHYNDVLAAATRAREELVAAINKGVPACVVLPNGGVDAMGVTLRCQLAGLINTYAWANTRLHLAAQMVCDVEDLEDDGEAEGIRWEVKL